jgi:general stress protein 26
MVHSDQQDGSDRGRPYMPGYGISSRKEGMLNWDWVDQQMAQSRNYWIGSTRPDGRPHSAPVWGVWMDGVLYFGTNHDARKTRNLTANPAVVVHLESGDEVVIFEGTVEPVDDKKLLVKIADAFEAKYPPFRPDPEEEPAPVTFRLIPQVVFAWRESDFVNTATRWVFNKEAEQAQRLGVDS